jgi:ribosomal-protein-alanine N-acetyltransferase
MLLRTIESRRMTLVAANARLLEADLESRSALAELLSAEVPENWPPDLYERQAMKFALQMLRDDPKLPGWSFWYLLTRTPDAPKLLGLCGFKGRPDETGSVEIGYSVLEQFQTQGYATEAVTRLLVWAFSHQNVREVSAETLPHLRKSIRVMEKNGFSFTGPGSEHGVIRYAVKKTDGR